MEKSSYFFKEDVVMKDKVPPTSSEYTKWLKKTSNLQLTLSDSTLRIPAYKRSSIVSQIPYSLCPSQSELLSFKSSLSDVTIPPPEEPPFIPDIIYTFTSAGLDTSVWSPYTSGFVDVVSQTIPIDFINEGIPSPVYAPQPGDYMARMRTQPMEPGSPNTQTVLVLPFYSPGRSIVTFDIKFLSFDSTYQDIVSVLDVVMTEPTSTTSLYSATIANYPNPPEWLTITGEILNGGYHYLTFMLTNGGQANPIGASQLLIYSVRIQRDNV